MLKTLSIAIFLGTLMSLPAHADITYEDLPGFLQSFRGRYTGTYGVLKKKSCSVRIEFSEKREFSELPKYITVSVKHGDDWVRSMEIQAGHFLGIENNKLWYPSKFNLKFNSKNELRSVSLIKQGATFIFQTQSCSNLIKQL